MCIHKVWIIFKQIPQFVYLYLNSLYASMETTSIISVYLQVFYFSTAHSLCNCVLDCFALIPSNFVIYRRKSSALLSQCCFTYKNIMLSFKVAKFSLELNKKNQCRLYMRFDMVWFNSLSNVLNESLQIRSFLQRLAKIIIKKLKKMFVEARRNFHT